MVLTPEQRLLLEQRAIVRDPSSQGTARRIAGSGQNDLSVDDQGVASVALQAPSTLPPRKQEDQGEPLSPEQAAAILGAILTPPPR